MEEKWIYSLKDIEDNFALLKILECVENGIKSSHICMKRVPDWKSREPGKRQYFI